MEIRVLCRGTRTSVSKRVCVHGRPGTGDGRCGLKGSEVLKGYWSGGGDRDRGSSSIVDDLKKNKFILYVMPRKWPKTKFSPKLLRNIH